MPRHQPGDGDEDPPRSDPRVESTDPTVERAVKQILNLLASQDTPRTVLIDGPSGSGKTTLSDRLTESWEGQRPQLLRLDWMYPGWHGLYAASVALADHVLLPRAAGRNGRWRRWNWRQGVPGNWSVVRADADLIVEGCGAFNRRSADVPATRVWIQASDEQRKTRALARDDGGFDEHWLMWDEQWRHYVRMEHPAELAEVHIDLTKTGGPA